MQSAFIITDNNKNPYAVISILAGGTEFYPIAENAKDEFTVEIFSSILKATISSYSL